MNLIPGRRQSVEYSANYFIFIVFWIVFLLIYACANFPEKDNKFQLALFGFLDCTSLPKLVGESDGSSRVGDLLHFHACDIRSQCAVSTRKRIHEEEIRDTLIALR